MAIKGSTEQISVFIPTDAANQIPLFKNCLEALHSSGESPNKDADAAGENEKNHMLVDLPEPGNLWGLLMVLKLLQSPSMNVTSLVLSAVEPQAAAAAVEVRSPWPAGHSADHNHSSSQLQKVHHVRAFHALPRPGSCQPEP